MASHGLTFGVFVPQGWKMELAGIDRNTANPPGGEILKDAQGNPIGVLRETASGLIARALAAARARRSPAG